MRIYIDADYRCHTEDAPGRTQAETVAFDGKCAAYIEGCRYIPAGGVWTRGDGMIFHGEMLAPWKPYAESAAAQAGYDEAQQTIADLAEYAAQVEYQLALNELGMEE